MHTGRLTQSDQEDGFILSMRKRRKFREGACLASRICPLPGGCTLLPTDRCLCSLLSHKAPSPLHKEAYQTVHSLQLYTAVQVQHVPTYILLANLARAFIYRILSRSCPSILTFLGGQNATVSLEACTLCLKTDHFFAN